MAYLARYNQSAKTYAVFSDSGGFANIDDVVKMLNERSAPKESPTAIETVWR